MSKDRNGVALVGHILAQTASGEPCTAAGLADRLGATRTTTFEVLRRLEAAGLVERDARGLIAPGQSSGALGFAAFGLASLADAAAALLPALRDDTESHTELVARSGSRTIVLMRRSSAAWTAERGETADLCLEMPIAAGRGEAFLRLRMRSRATLAEQTAAWRSLDAVARSLAECLQPSPQTSE